MAYDRTVYSWDGVQTSHVGNPIYEELRGLTDPTTVDKIFSTVATQRTEYWLVLPTGDAFIYDYDRQVWTRDTVPQFTALGEVEVTTTAPRWIDMTTFWNTETHTWNQLFGVSMTSLFGGRPDGSTALVDETVAYDYFSIGSIIDRFVETPDFYFPDPAGDVPAGTRLGTIYRLLLTYQFINANPFIAGVSYDRGRSWHEQSVAPNPQGFSLVDFGGPTTGNTVRFRFREQDATGQFRWRSYTYDFIDAGDYIGTVTG